MVDGLLANLGVGIVSRFCSSLPAFGLPVLGRTGFSSVAFLIPRVKHSFMRSR